MGPTSDAGNEYSSSGVVTYNGSLPECRPVENTTAGTPFVLQPYSSIHLWVTSVILGLIILATIIGNVFVIAAVILERNLHNVANYLVTSLAVADLMVAALVMPLAAVNEVSTHWFLGPEVCDMWISFDVLCCTSSILHLVAIALDRYWAVTQLDYIHNRSGKRILLMIALSWLISAAISIPPLFGWKEPTNSADLTGECLISQDWGYTVYSTLGAFYLPLVVIIIIYIKIFRAARFRIRKKNFKPSAQSSCGTAMTVIDSGTPRPLLKTQASHGHTNGDALKDNENAPPSISPEPSSNGSGGALNDSNRNSKHMTLTPPASPLLNSGYPDKNQGHKSSWLDLTKSYLQEGLKRNSPCRAKKSREKIEVKRERKAARTLAIITGTFISCWLPFFILALLRPFCGEACPIPVGLISVIGWLGYFNSLLNPVIYTIFNPDFRSAFRKILFGKYRKSRSTRYTRAAGHRR